MTGPRRVVFTDVDETLINCKSMLDFLDYYFTGRYGAAGQERAGRLRGELAGMAARGVLREQANRHYYRAWRGERADVVARWGGRWFADRSAGDGFYLPHTRAALDRHRRAGDLVVLVSGSFPALLDPLAAAIGTPDVLCSRPQSRGGVLTGELEGAPVIGEGKRSAVLDVLRRHPGVRPADCWGYGDHGSDLPMLAMVGHPVVVGDDPGLHAHLPRALRLPGARVPAAD